MQIKVRPFSSEEVERFCDFSETYYDQMETNDVSFVTWKMKCNTSQPAEHLTIEEDGKMLGRAALFTRTYVTGIIHHGDTSHRFDQTQRRQPGDHDHPGEELYEAGTRFFLQYLKREERPDLKKLSSSRRSSRW